MPIYGIKLFYLLDHLLILVETFSNKLTPLSTFHIQDKKRGKERKIYASGRPNLGAATNSLISEQSNWQR